MANPPQVIKFAFDDRFFSYASLNCDEPIVFHYTNAAGALGIVRSRELWCSSAYALNDSAEIKYAHEQLLGATYQKLRGADEAFRDAFRAALQARLGQIARAHVFLVSFSEAQDLLSQWRGYAQPNGYSLGFSLGELRKAASEQGYDVEDVVYEERAQRRLLDPVADRMIAAFGAAYASDRAANPLWPFVVEFSRIAPRLKHPAFAEEREWRLFTGHWRGQIPNHDFVVRQDQLRHIAKFNLCRGKREEAERMYEDVCIRTLDTGPGPDADIRSDALFSLVHECSVYWRSAGRSKARLR
jgi:hypothetical protein